MPQTNRRTGRGTRARGVRGAMVAGVAGALAAMAGCSTIGGLIGGMAQSDRLHSTQTVEAKYPGLAGKSFAVVVAADRSVQADFPQVVGDLTITISEEIRKHAGPSGWVPPRDVLKYQYAHPGWSAMSLDKLAAEFGVQRLIYIDLREYRLNDPGNAYLWAGVASGTVSVLEADEPMSSEFAFQEPISVKFPDGNGFGPQQIPRETVRDALSRRFADRASWLFFAHEEKYYPEY